jgi:hypothetical protein
VVETAADAAHVQPGTACYGCHQTLDPMRELFRQSYNYYYSRQTPAILAAEGVSAMGTFTVAGSAPVVGTGVATLARGLAEHPRFAVAWTQKLCRLANSASCDEADPEFVRVAKAFTDSKLDFATLVRELFSSPLTTFQSPTLSAERSGIVIGIQRRETLCAALSNRLGLADVCALHGTAGLKGAEAAQARTAGNLASAVPGDGYSRGAETPLMPHDPNLFFTAGLENLCATLAAQLVDPKGAAATAAGTHFSSVADKKGAALDAFVSDLMGAPVGDARAPELRAILAEHDAAALAAGETATDALRSTFVLACSSPLTISSGL